MTLKFIQCAKRLIFSKLFPGINVAAAKRVVETNSFCPALVARTLDCYVIVRTPALSFCSTTSFFAWQLFFPQRPSNNGRTFSTSTITRASSYMAWYFNDKLLHFWRSIKSFWTISCNIFLCSLKVTGPISCRTSVELHVLACTSWGRWTPHSLSSLGHDSIAVRVALSSTESARELRNNKFVQND